MSLNTADSPLFVTAGIEHVLGQARRLAPHPSPVLLTGETGTGKEIVASEIHRLSGRKGPFVPVNCAVIPDQLAASELFGHERGAFTGAHMQRKGYVEAADGGTLFLDEIGELSGQLQAALLRVIELHEFYRVGGTQLQSSDVRIIAATNRDVSDPKGNFRKDLFHRLSFRLEIPALRDRPFPAIRTLLSFFGPKYAPGKKFLDDAVTMLEAYHWPGNIREFENVIQRIGVLFSTGDTVTSKDVGNAIGIPMDSWPHRSRDSSAVPMIQLSDSVAIEQLRKNGYHAMVRDHETQLRAYRMRLLRAVLAECHDNMSAAARLLKMNRPALYNLLGRDADDGKGE